MSYSAPQAARIVTMLNLKGGVGKTHATWLLASVCQERGRRVLLIDTDTQGNLTSSFLDEQQIRPGVETVFQPGREPDIRGLIRRTVHEHIDLIPASTALAPFDLSNQTEWEAADLHLALGRVLEPVRADYDLILIDCPPRLSLVSFAALCASDGVIIPMEAADWGAQGITRVTAAVEYVRRHHNGRLKLLGYLVSRFKRARAFQRTYTEQLRKHFGDLSFDVTVPDLAIFEKSVCSRIPITIYSPRSRAADIAREFYDEVQRRLQGDARSRDTGRDTGVLREPVAAAAA